MYLSEIKCQVLAGVSGILQISSEKVWPFQIKSVTLSAKGTNRFCYSKMRTQVFDENRNVLAEYEAKVSSRPRARIVRVKNIEYFGFVPKSRILPVSAAFPKM